MLSRIQSILEMRRTVRVAASGAQHAPTTDKDPRLRRLPRHPPHSAWRLSYRARLLAFGNAGHSVTREIIVGLGCKGLQVPA